MARKLNKTTMAKINREHRLRERKADKQARKERRRAQTRAPMVDAPEAESTTVSDADPGGESPGR